MTRPSPPSRSTALLATFFLASLACGPEKPPAPDRPATAASPAGSPATADAGPVEAPVLPAEPTDAILTYAGERGAFKDTNKPAEVPEDARGLVRVTLLAGPEPPPGRVWAANLRSPEPDGGWKLTTVERALFEELALGQGRASAVDRLAELPPGLEAPPVAPAGADVIVYKTDWCGVCKQLTAYLDRKGVQYVARDIEKDPAAASELREKSAKKGLKTGSVPVIDVRGELMVGFDRARLESLL
jgi:glutaredoxin